MLSFALKSSVWLERSERHNVSSLFQEIKLLKLKLYIYNNHKTTVYLMYERKPTAFWELSSHTHPWTAIKIFPFYVNDLRELWAWELRLSVPGPLNVKALSHPRCWRNCLGFLEKKEAQEHFCFKNVMARRAGEWCQVIHCLSSKPTLPDSGFWHWAQDCRQFCLAHTPHQAPVIGVAGKAGVEERDRGFGSWGWPDNGTSSGQQWRTPVHGLSPPRTHGLLAPLQRHQHWQLSPSLPKSGYHSMGPLLKLRNTSRAQAWCLLWGWPPRPWAPPLSLRVFMVLVSSLSSILLVHGGSCSL